MIAFPYAEGAGIARLLPWAPVPAPFESYGSGADAWFGYWRAIAGKWGHPSAGTVDSALELSRWLNALPMIAMAQAAEEDVGNVRSPGLLESRFHSLMQEMETVYYREQGKANPRAVYDAQFRSALAAAPDGAIVEYGAKLTALDSGAFQFTEPLRMAALPSAVEPPPVLDLAGNNPSTPVGTDESGIVSLVTPVVLNTSIPMPAAPVTGGPLIRTIAPAPDMMARLAQLWIPLAGLVVAVLVLRKRRGAR